MKISFSVTSLVLSIFVGLASFPSLTHARVETDKTKLNSIQSEYDGAIFTPNAPPSVSVQAAPVDPLPGGGGGGDGDGGVSGIDLMHENINAKLTIQTTPTEHTTDLLGEQVDTDTGALTFTQADVSLPGNFALPVAFQRSFKGALFSFYNTLDVGDWMIDIPHIHTTLLRNGIRYSGSWGQGLECSGPLNPGEILFYGSTYANYEYWNGDTLNVPGRTSEKLMENAGYLTGAVVYQKVTKSGWRIRCESNPNSSGEQFIAQAPNGDTYTFSRLRLIKVKPIEKDFKAIARYQAYMMATRVEDVHGNVVRYHYDNQGRVIRISASDGRELIISYQDNRVASVSAGARTWTYHYTGNSLTRVTRPDNRYWSYNISEMGLRQAETLRSSYDSLGESPTCRHNVGTKSFTVSIKHPDGLTGEFTLKQRRISKANTLTVLNWTSTPNPECRTGYALGSKRITGPGLSTALEWHYWYDDPEGYFDNVTPGTDARLEGTVPNGVNRYTTRKTRVKSPGGSITEYFYNRDASSYLQGSLIAKRQLAANGIDILKTSLLSYRPSERIGLAEMLFTHLDSYEKRADLKQRRVDWHLSNQDIYTTAYSDFTRFGSPRVEVQSGSAGSRRIERDYQTLTDLWLIDRPTAKRVDDISETTWSYDNWGNVTSIVNNGVNHTFAYNNGQLVKYVSPRGFETTYADYYRGIPRQIERPMGTETRAVNRYGEITAMTNALNITTTYAYDALGRLAEERPAIGIPTTYDWRANAYTVTQGAHVNQYTLDGFHRVIREADSDVSTNDTRYRERAYTPDGQLAFESTWSHQLGNGVGNYYTYDALQRKTRVQTPYGDTQWRYLSNNRVEETDPRGFITTRYYSGYGSAGDGELVRIEAPSSSGTIVTSLTYDSVGRAQSIQQAGQTIRYRYDSVYTDYVVAEQYPAFTHHYERDAAGNAIKRWVGSEAPTVRTFNAQDQVTHINYPGQTADATYTYRADGEMVSASNGDSAWTYSYNALGQLTEERLEYEGNSYAFTYRYNDAHALTQRRYPDGYTVNYAPDGRGQATQAGDIVTGLTRHSDGRMRSMQLGNGLTSYRLMDEEGLRLARTQVVRSGSSVIDKSYDYDAAGNLILVFDAVHGAQSIDNLTYDGVNRLTSAHADAFGTMNYAYDRRGNLTSLAQDGVSQTYHYDAQDQLMSVSGRTHRQFSYDSAGRVTHTGIDSLSYNGAGRLTQLGDTQYQYDAHGHRLTVEQGGQKRLTVYSREGALLMSAQNGHSSYKIILDGETVAQVGDDLSPASQQGYTGHVGDNTGLVYMQARYYDPVIGRFYSNDPVGVMEHIARGNPIHGFGRYTYANNNPYKYVDPDGEFGLLGAAIGAVVGGVSSIAVQSFTGDGKINWSTVGAATVTGAAVGATGGLAGAAVAKIGLTGAEAAATVLIPSSGVAAVGGAVTQMVENTANGDPLNKGVALSAGAAATGTIVGGVTGDKIVGALTKSPVMGEAGKLAGGKATGEAIATATQEGIAQGITNSCTGEICE